MPGKPSVSSTPKRNIPPTDPNLYQDSGIPAPGSIARRGGWTVPESDDDEQQFLQKESEKSTVVSEGLYDDPQDFNQTQKPRGKSTSENPVPQSTGSGNYGMDLEEEDAQQPLLRAATSAASFASTRVERRVGVTSGVWGTHKHEDPFLKKEDMFAANLSLKGTIENQQKEILRLRQQFAKNYAELQQTRLLHTEVTKLRNQLAEAESRLSRQERSLSPQQQQEFEALRKENSDLLARIRVLELEKSPSGKTQATPRHQDPTGAVALPTQISHVSPNGRARGSNDANAERITELENRLNKSEGANRALQQQVNTKTRDLEQANSTIQSLKAEQSRATKTTSRFAQPSEAEDNLRQSLNQAQESFRAEQTKNRTLSEANARLTKELQEKTAQVGQEAAQQRLRERNAEQRITAREQELARQEENVVLREQRIRGAEEKFNETAKENAKLKDALRQLKSELQRREEPAAAARATEPYVQRQAGEGLKALNDQVANLRGKLEEAQKSNRQLQRELAAKRDVEARQPQGSRRGSQERSVTFQDPPEEGLEIAAKIAEYKQTITRLRAERNGLKAELASRDEASRTRNSEEGIDSQIASLQQANARLVGELEQARINNDNLYAEASERLKGAEREIESTTAALHATEDANASLKVTNQQLDAKYKKLKTDVKNLIQQKEEEVQTANSKIIHYVEALNKARDEIATLEQRLQTPTRESGQTQPASGQERQERSAPTHQTAPRGEGHKPRGTAGEASRDVDRSYGQPNDDNQWPQASSFDTTQYELDSPPPRPPLHPLSPRKTSDQTRQSGPTDPTPQKIAADFGDGGRGGAGATPGTIMNPSSRLAAPVSLDKIREGCNKFFAAIRLPENQRTLSAAIGFLEIIESDRTNPQQKQKAFDDLSTPINKIIDYNSNITSLSSRGTEGKSLLDETTNIVATIFQRPQEIIKEKPSEALTRILNQTNQSTASAIAASTAGGNTPRRGGR